jgi:hypothetical protein
MGIFLNSRFGNFIRTSVVTEMDDFTTSRLEYSAEDANRCIVTIENCRRGDYSDWSFATKNISIGIGYHFLRRGGILTRSANHALPSQQPLKRSPPFNRVKNHYFNQRRIHQ